MTEKKSVNEEDKLQDRREKYEMYSENLIRETEKEMKEIDTKKRLAYVRGIALDEKSIL
jgi:hypothetical protein